MLHLYIKTKRNAPDPTSGKLTFNLIAMLPAKTLSPILDWLENAI
jgi:hypothetical protein